MNLIYLEKDDEMNMLSSILTEYSEKGQDYFSYLETWAKSHSEIKSITLIDEKGGVINKVRNLKNEKSDFIIRKNLILSDNKSILEAKINLEKHQNQMILLGIQFFLASIFLTIIFGLILFKFIYDYAINPLQREIEKEYHNNKSILDNLHLGISLLDSEMNIIKANQIIQEWYGDRFIGKKYHKCNSCVNPDVDHICYDCPMIKSLKDGKVHETSRTIILNGEIRHHRVMSYPIIFENRISEVIEIIEDITDKVIDEDKFRRSYRMQKILTQCTQSLIHSEKEEVLLQKICQIIIDSGFYKLAWIGFCNNDLKSIKPVAQAGFDEGFLSSAQISCDLSTSDYSPVALAIHNNHTKVIHDIEYEALNTSWKDAAIEKGFNSMLSIPLRIEGSVIGALSVFAEQKFIFDEEEINLLEKLSDELSYGIQTFRRMSASTKLIEINQSLKNDKDMAEIANRQKSEFLAIISHEIRTPLTGILGMTELLSQSSLSPEQKSYLNIIKSTANLQLHIINDILDLSKIENGKLILDKSEFKLVDLIEDVTLSFQWQIQVKRLSLRVEFGDDIPADFLGDPLRIKQILYNLIGNAVKFTENGIILIKVEKKYMDSAICKLKFSIIDSGIGIPKDKQSSIFESYTQADISITKEYGGTGLGTTISKKLVGLMGGSIGLNSPVSSTYSLDKSAGPGTEFWFILELNIAEKIIDSVNPINPEKNKRKKSMSVGRKKNNKNHILVVEDNEVNQTLIKIMLEKMSYNVDIAKNGLFALEMIEKRSYGIIFMDIEMPELNGIETVKIMRNEKGVNIPIIALTANVLINDLKKYLQSGMNDFLIKPFKQDDLFRISEKWLKNGNQNREDL